MKKRITITLDKTLLGRIDSIVDNHKVKNRSHAISLLANRALRLSVPDTAVILCGGKKLTGRSGSDSHVLSLIKGKPLVLHLIDLFKKYGVTKIYFIVGKLKEDLEEQFGDGDKLGIKISYVEEKIPLGTGGALKLLSDKLSSPFFVSNCDELKNINLHEMFEYHKKNKSFATIALTTVEDVSQYGAVAMSGMRILEFVEKPKQKDAPSNLINAGLYLVRPGIFDLIPVGQSSLEKEIFPKIIKQNGLFGFIFSGQWFDVNTVNKYKIALKEWKGI